MRSTMKLLAAVALLVATGCDDGNLELTPPAGDTPDRPADAPSQEASILAAPFQGPEIAAAETGRPAPKIPDAEFVIVPGGDPLVVDDDLAECPDAGTTTIQEAVDAAAGMPGPNDIEVCPGTYTEDVTIGPNNPVKIKGSGVGMTVVEAPAGSNGPIFDIMNAGRVDIEKLTVDGLSTMGGGVDWGIRYVNTDGKVKEVAVQNVRNASGNAQSIGVAFRTNDGGPWENKLEKSWVTNFTRVGAFVDGVGQWADIKDNRFQGHDPPRVWAANGMQISRGAAAKVEKNEIRDAISGNPPGGLASAVLLFCAGPTEVKGNDIWTSDIGVVFEDNQWGVGEGNTHWNPNFHGHSIQFDGFSSIPAFGCPNVPTPAMNNTLKRNRVFDAGEIGINVSNEDGVPPRMNHVLENEIRGTFLEGILLEDAHENHVKKNKVEDAGRNGMRFRIAHMNHVEDNDVKRPDSHGMRVDNSNDNMFSRNRFDESGFIGIRVFASDGNDFLENRADRSGEDGIHVFDNSENNLFQKNETKKSGDNSCEDESVGAGTAGTANTWMGNKGERPSIPAGIC